MVATGAMPLQSEENFFQLVHVQLHVSRRMHLEVGVWQYSLQSPFWRIYMVGGRGAYVLHEGRKTHLLPGRLYMLPAWLPFHTGLTKPVVQDFLHFNVTGLPPTLIRRVFDRPVVLVEDILLRELSKRWRSSLDSVSPDVPAQQGGWQPGSSLKLQDFCWAQALIHSALAMSLARMPAARRALCARWAAELPELQPLLDLIDARLADPPTNAELAKMHHVSTSHLIRIFRQKMGLTPAQYRLERRVSVAAAWLTSTDWTLEHIADKAGFTDRFHFSKAFKSCLGVPPVTYRLMHIKENSRST